MRRIWKYTVDKMRNVWNCEHTLLCRSSKMRRLSVKNALPVPLARPNRATLTER
jgi:hypothetical protein